MKRSVVVVLLAVLSLAGLSGCGGNSSASGSSGGGGAASSPVPTPTGQVASALVAKLQHDAPGIGTDTNALIQASVAVCAAVRSDESPGDLANLAADQFGTGTYSPTQLDLLTIIEDITSSFCS